MSGKAIRDINTVVAKHLGHPVDNKHELSSDYIPRPPVAHPSSVVSTSLPVPDI